MTVMLVTQIIFQKKQHSEPSTHHTKPLSWLICSELLFTETSIIGVSSLLIYQPHRIPEHYYQHEKTQKPTMDKASSFHISGFLWGFVHLVCALGHL